jgi:hypothetical protein
MPYAWVIIVILWWIVSAVSKAAQQKKAAQNANQQANRGQAAPVNKPRSIPRPAPKKAADGDGWEGRGMPASPELASASQPAASVKHEARPLEAHMHTPVMGIEGVGNEGEDCCHEYMLDQPAEQPADFLPMQEETEGLRAKALLQGVIYSEILGRRPVKRYGKRPA